MNNQTEKQSVESGNEDNLEKSNSEIQNKEQTEVSESKQNPEESGIEQRIMEPKYEKIISILISYPSEIESMFGSTMIYKVYLIFQVVIETESGKKELFRRYSEFFELRKALISRFPCIFILPVHKRQFIGNKSRSFLLQRVYELNTFARYILTRDFLISSEVVQTFFHEPDFKKVTLVFKNSEKPSPDELYKNYQFIFSKLKEKEDFQEPADTKHAKIEKFKQKVETNIEFFYRLKNNVESFASKRQEFKSQDEENQIYEMILITYSNQTEKYEKLKKDFNKMTNYEQDAQWSLFSHKIEMLIRELEFFYDMISQLRYYENKFMSNEEQKRRYKEKLASLGNSEEESVGFFKRQNRREVIQKYQDLLFETEQKSVFWKDLLQFIYNIMIHSEMNIFKERKRYRYSEILKDFGELKKENLNYYHNFWKTIIESDDAPKKED